MRLHDHLHILASFHCPLWPNATGIIGPYSSSLTCSKSWVSLQKSTTLFRRCFTNTWNDMPDSGNEKVFPFCVRRTPHGCEWSQTIMPSFFSGRQPWWWCHSIILYKLAGTPAVFRAPHQYHVQYVKADLSFALLRLCASLGLDGDALQSTVCSSCCQNTVPLCLASSRIRCCSQRCLANVLDGFCMRSNIPLFVV